MSKRGATGGDGQERRVHKGGRRAKSALVTSRSAKTRPEERVVSFGPYRLNMAAQTLFRGDQLVRLRGRAMDILLALARQPGRTVSHADIMQIVWPSIHVTENTLRVHITALRKALGGREDGGQYVLSSSGRGYKLVSAASDPRKTVFTAPPHYPLRLVGRDDLTASVMEAFQEKRLVSLVGPGGVGKTSIALVLAQRLRSEFPDGCVYVDFSPVSRGQDALTTMATALGIKPSTANLDQSLVQSLQGQRILVILDTCEHVIEDAARLGMTLLAAGPNIRILSTSRERLRLQEEWVCGVSGLPVPAVTKTLTAEKATSFPAVELFYLRARAVGADLPLTDANARLIAEICYHLDGLPLAIELAAARVGDFGPSELLKRLSSRFGVLVEGYRDGQPRHQNLHATVAWSYALLSEGDRAIFLKLGIFRDAISLEAAHAVAASENSSEEFLQDTLARLSAKSLLAPVDIAGSVHFRLLDTNREFAKEMLHEFKTYDNVAERHAAYYLELLRSLWPDDLSTSINRDFARRLYEDVLAAIRWAEHSGSNRLYLDLVVAAIPLWFELSLVDQCHCFATAALQRVPSTPDFLAHRMSLNSAIGGVLLNTSGASTETTKAWTTVLQIAERIGDQKHRQRALWGLWIDHRNRGLYHDALALARRFDTGCAADEMSVYRGLANGMLGVSLFLMGRFDEGQEYLTRVLQEGEAGHQTSIGTFQLDQSISARGFVAFQHWIMGRSDEALAIAESNVLDALKRDHATSLCHALTEAAFPIAWQRGLIDEAERYNRMILDVSDDANLQLWNLLGRCYRGMTAVARGAVVEGVTELEETLAVLGQAGAGPINGEYALALATLGRYEKAIAVIDAEIALCTSGERWFLAEYYRIKGEIHRHRGEIDQADTWFYTSLSLAREQGAKAWELRSATSLAELLCSQGRMDEARAILHPIFVKSQAAGAVKDVARAHQVLSAFSWPAEVPLDKRRQARHR